MRLVRLTERDGEHEYDWFELASEDETAYEILLGFYGELDREDDYKDNVWWIDGCRTCWVYNDYPITETEIDVLRKFSIV